MAKLFLLTISPLLYSDGLGSPGGLPDDPTEVGNGEGKTIIFFCEKLLFIQHCDGWALSDTSSHLIL